MLNISFKIKKITVFTGNSTDKISFTFDGPTPFPEIQAENPKVDYDPVLKVEVRKGYAMQWLELVGLSYGHLASVEVIESSISDGK